MIMRVHQAGQDDTAREVYPSLTLARNAVGGHDAPSLGDDVTGGQRAGAPQSSVAQDAAWGTLHSFRRPSSTV
jgi:hypothetical protein